MALLAGAATAAADAAPAADAGVVWRAPVEVAAGGGHRGPWRMNESDYDYVDDPSVAIDEDGAIAVAWVDQALKDVYFQRFRSDGTPLLTAPVNVSRSPGVLSWLPRLVVAPGAGAVSVLWQEIVFSPGGSHGGEAFFARSTDGGATFGEPVNLSRSVAGDGKGRLTEDYWDNGSLDLALAPDGTLYAAWTEYQGALWLSRSADGGASFSAPSHVAGGAASPARAPSLAMGGDGAVHLAWAVGEDRAADIHFARSLDGGRSFGERQVVFAGPGHADAPKLAVDGQGTVHLVYAESPAGPFQAYRLLYTRRPAGAEAFAPPTMIFEPSAQGLASAHFPALAVDGRDRLYVLWERFPEGRQRSYGLGFTVSRDGGRTFAEPAVVPGSEAADGGFNGGQQGSLMKKLAVDRAGALAVVNSTFAGGRSSRVWLLRGQAAP